MAFNREVYLKTYLLPQAKKKLPNLPDNLFERYAVPPGVPSDVGLADHIKSVRATWHSVATASSQPPFAKNFAKQCLSADEELKKVRIGGKDYQSAAWWAAKKSEQQGAAQQRVDELAAVLKESNGAFGVVTLSYLEMCADRLSLDEAQARAAAKAVGLEVVGAAAIPDEAPFKGYRDLESQLSICGVATLVELVHPSCRPFTIAERFESKADPSARLDLAAVRNQFIDAERQANTPAWNAKRSALNLLRSAAESGVNLHQLALYQIVQSATASGVPGAAGIKATLGKLGVDERDANVLAVIVAEKAGSGPSGASKITQLLQEGRLREAKAIAQSLPPASSAEVKSILEALNQAQATLEGLLSDAAKLLAAGDEIAAAAKAREAETISQEDAEELLVTIPISAPLGLTIGADGAAVRLHWQPNVGHGSDTVYEVRRATGSAPENLASGTPVPVLDSTSAIDNAPPTAQTIYYSVFARVGGRPDSRATKNSVVSVPPVLDVGTEVGPDWVSAHWSTHAAVHHVEAVRRDGGRSDSVPVVGRSAQLTGLPEGTSVQLELTAIYEKPEGGTVRSASVTVTDTPRAAARPLDTLRATPITGSGGVQVRLTWTTVDRSEIRFRRSSSPPTWLLGDMISTDQRDAWGHDVAGSTENAGRQTRLDATLPAGIHYIVPFSKGGTGVMVGRPVAVGVTDAVIGLTQTSFNDVARLAWTWPETSSLVEVSWEREDDGADSNGLERYSRADYDTKGISVPLGASPCKVEVRALMMVGNETFASPPATLVISQISHAPITYTMDSSPGIGPFGGRNKTLNVRSDAPVGPVRIVLVALHGLVMPLEAADGRTILEQTLTLAPGGTASFKVQVPADIKKPFWVRAFLQSGNGQLVDPPLKTLKEG